MPIELKPIRLSGAEVLPIVEGGKGISASTGRTAGAFAAAGAVGTFSAVNADLYDEDGKLRPPVYHGRTRKERFEELVAQGIAGGIAQAKIAHEVAGGRGRIHMNILWEMGGAQRVLEGVLEAVGDLIHGVTAGAGMPFRLAPIAAKYRCYYYPIVSSARAFRALWLRSYRKYPEWLGGVVYEDPWLAGGHNGLSNAEDPNKPEPPYPRVVALRRVMNEFGLKDVPIIMAGGVWFLREWADWLDNPEIGPVAFQFGTRPLLTKESPISAAWKARLRRVRKGDVKLNRFSPTGFWSSAVYNRFLHELYERQDTEMPFTTHPMGDHTKPFTFGIRKKTVYLTPHDRERAELYISEGRTQALPTPDSTLVFVTPEKAREIRKDQLGCMGCLSQCLFSNWATNELGTTGRKADPRSYCIQKTLQDIAHGGDPDENLMFAGHNAYRFAEDPLFANGREPTIKELVDAIARGD
ncbi:MAG: nitronate monooxygenase [Zetaproteobacteria bacterium]|nr:MAG: nitronate monooxygenase [Zetaproteobacteria bacterium]